MPFISASAISPYNSIRGGAAGPASTLLLDLYPGAGAAYSLRKLSSAYTGDAIRVRVDTTGQPTYDIGFDANGDLDTVDLLSKAGSNSAYVDIWYDQSGEGINATQTSASKQPVIVGNGVVNELNGEPAMNFLSPFLMELNLSQYPFTSGGSATEKSFFAVALNDSTVNQNLYNIADARDIYAMTYNRSANNTYAFLGANYGAIGGDITGQNIISSLAISPSSETFNNAVEGTDSNLTRANFNIKAIGSRGGSFPMNGEIQELVMYESNQSSNRAGIESNINSHYNVFWDGSQTGILDDYPGSTAAYSLRALNSAYTGYAIRVRRSSDGDFKDIGLLYDGSLDTESLLSFAGSGNATVQTWYDQSGEGNNAVQATLSRQPNIVENGVLVTMLDEPAMDTTSQPNSGFINSSPSNLKPANSSSSIFALGRDSGTAASTRHLLAYSNTDIRFAYLAGSNVILRSQIWGSNGTSLTTEVSATNNIPFIATSIRGQSFQTIFNNGVQGQNKTGLVTPTANTTGILSLFSIGNNFSFEGFYSELIFYPSDQSANRAGIESNINSNYNIYWDGSQTGLLDDYPNAAAAYSLRALSSEYTGAAIKVRKTVAGVTSTKDIGLLYDGTLDTESLLSFAGSDDVYVQIWYDQSGEGNDATQVSASAQPQIVSSGSVITENGEPSVEFNGTTDYIQNQLSVGPTVTAFAVSKIVDEPDYNFIYDSFGTGARLRSGLWVTQEYFADNGDGLIAEATTASDGNQHLFFAKHTNSDVSISVNQDTLQTVESTNFSQTTQHWNIGARNDGAEHFLDGTIQELIIYPSDESTNRAGIESNVNEHYNVFWDGSQDGLLDDYPNASAAYSLRALSSSYTGPAIRVTTTGSDFKDIGLLYDGSLDTASLLTFAGGGDVFVTTWYDQSGEGNDVAQGGQSAQPQIVSSGVVVTTSDNYAIDFSGSTKTLVNATFDNSTQVSSVFTIVKSTSSAPQVITDGVDLANRQVSGYYAGSPSVFAINRGVTIKSTAPINTNINLLSTFFDVNSDLYLNGEQILNSVNPGNHTREGFTLGSGLGAAASFEGSIFEVIVFDEQNKSSDRVEIETNINNYYNVY